MSLDHLGTVSIVSLSLRKFLHAWNAKHLLVYLYIKLYSPKHEIIYIKGIIQMLLKFFLCQRKDDLREAIGYQKCCVLTAVFTCKGFGRGWATEPVKNEFWQEGGIGFLTITGFIAGMSRSSLVPRSGSGNLTRAFLIPNCDMAGKRILIFDTNPDFLLSVSFLDSSFPLDSGCAIFGSWWSWWAMEH